MQKRGEQDLSTPSPLFRAVPALSAGETGALPVRLDRQGYKVVGSHSAVKLCHWTRERLVRGRPCYKGRFYGIASHRCLQMSPSLYQCNENCLFCWRTQDYYDTGFPEIDGPEDVLDGCLKAQRALVSGFGGDGRVKEAEWKEALTPRHVAISLAGEPTFYPRLGGFIEACRKRGLTTFLVTNGTNPRALERLDPLPDQLYVTVAAPTPEVFGRLCVPQGKDGWARLNETLRLLPSLRGRTRTVIRHTLVQGWNLGWEREYAALDALAEPDFIECKAYMFVGNSRRLLTIENMPSHSTVREFTVKMAAALPGYGLADEAAGSRVTLLQREGANRRLEGR